MSLNKQKILLSQTQELDQNIGTFHDRLIQMSKSYNLELDNLMWEAQEQKHTVVNLEEGLALEKE